MTKNSLEEIIDRLGGVLEVSAALKINASNVYAWQKRGWVAINYVHDFAKLANVDPIVLINARLCKKLPPKKNRYTKNK